MKYILCVLFSCTFLKHSNAQQLAGLWYSSDSTRVYEITNTGNDHWKVTIHSSTRKGDKIGYEVARQIVYNKQKKRFEGYLYSTADEQPVFVKINFDKTNTQVINLLLQRMFFLNVKFNWARVQQR